MINTMTDVILLCKGWYNKDKYPTLLDALKEYYRRNYSENMEQYLNERFITEVILKNVMEDIVTRYPDRMYGFINPYLFYGSLFIVPDESNNDYYYSLFYRIVHFLGNLQMQGDGLVTIDTDGYFHTEIDEYQRNRIVLLHDII